MDKVMEVQMSVRKAWEYHRTWSGIWYTTAQKNLRAEMVLTAGCTASGRQCRPTEKETYRILKARGHPKIFDSEPAGLLSDVDRDEDSMFSDCCVTTRLSDQQALTFSMRKTPPTVLARKPTSKIRTKPKKASTTVVTSYNDSDSEGSSDSNDSTKFVDSMDNAENKSDCGTDNTANDHDEVAKGSSPPVVSTKHQREDSEVLNTDTKFKKGPNGTCQRLQASDFDDVTKDLLTTAMSIYRCLVVTRAPFAEMLIIETKLAKDAWREASNMAELTIQLTPSLVKMMTKRTSHIECCIDEWMTGVKEDIKFSSVAYSPVYLLHLNSLQRFEEQTAAYKLFSKIGVNLLDVAWMHAGVDLFMTAVTIDSFTDDVFDDAIREHEAKAQEAQEAHSD
ncbi:hypothetical protein BDR03DRAFT_1017946 [Suillus americanus]|nr:hypothetical protein BDR03DRAFT_1017946 [Suillus americanus]